MHSSVGSLTYVDKRGIESNVISDQVVSHISLLFPAEFVAFTNWLKSRLQNVCGTAQINNNAGSQVTVQLSATHTP